MSVMEVRKVGWSYVLDEPMRILVADDDPILREFASVHLSTPTATIVTAEDGLQALRELRSTPCDVAVVDIEMPNMDGFELLAAIREDSALSRLPVMMLTGHEDIASIDRAFTLGASGFASKPVNWRLLSYQIRYVLRSCALEQQIRATGHSVASFRKILAEHKELRTRCETTVREAREVLSTSNAYSTEVQAICLRRIMQSLNEVVEGDVFEIANAAPQLVPES